MKKLLFPIVAALIIYVINLDQILAQEEELFDSDTTHIIEVYLIDNYVKNEQGNVLILSWMTNIPCKSKVKIPDIGTFEVSDTLTEFHQTQINLSNYQLTKPEFLFFILSETEDGKFFESEEYSFTVELLTQNSIKQEEIKSTNYLLNFLLGVGLWLLPSPALAIENSNSKFAIHKELPLVSLGYSSIRAYPWVYYHIGYLHIVDGLLKNSFRTGIKGIVQIKPIERFTAIGASYFTNFKGNNGLSLDLGFSLFKVLRTFDFCINYSYNFEPKDKYKFHLISFGFFTPAFSININH